MSLPYLNRFYGNVQKACTSWPIWKRRISTLANRPRSTCFLYISVKALWVRQTHQQNHGTSFLQLKNIFLETHTNIVLSSGKSHSWSADRRIGAPNCKGNNNDFRKSYVQKLSFIEAKMALGSKTSPSEMLVSLRKLLYFYCLKRALRLDSGGSRGPRKSI